MQNPIIQNLQDFKVIVIEVINKEKDYHKASKLSFMVDKIDTFIKDVIEFDELCKQK